MAVCDSPTFLAIYLAVQWVRCSGRVSEVAHSTRSTHSSLIERGAPGRGSSCRLASQCSRNRSRHLPTVGLLTCKWLATTTGS